MFYQDPDNSKKQVPAGITYPSTSHIPVFTTDVTAQVVKPAPGTMTYSTESNKVFIYDGTAWGYRASEFISSFTNDYSLAFEGVDEYVDISITNFMDADFSISCWMNADNANVDSWAGLGIGSNYQNGLKIAYNRLLYKDDAANVYVEDFSPAPSNDEWNHFVISHDLSTKTFSMYLNANTATTSTYSDNLLTDRASSDNLYISSLGRPFIGYIDEVSVFNAALSSADVTSLYNNGEPNDLSELANLHGWWRMGDDDTHPTITDNSGVGNDGTMINMVSGDIEENTP